MSDKPTDNKNEYPPPGDRPTPPPKPRNEYQPIQNGAPAPPSHTESPPVRRTEPYMYGRRRHRQLPPITGESAKRPYPPEGHTTPLHVSREELPIPDDSRRRPPSGDRQSRNLPPQGERRRPPSARPPMRRPRPHHEELPIFPDESEIPTPIGRRPDGRRPRRRARRRTQMAAVYIIIIVAVVSISLTAFAMAFPRMFDPERRLEAAAAIPSPTPTPTPLPLNTRNLTGLVTAMAETHVTIMDISNNNTRHFNLTEDTALSNRFGTEMEAEHLSIGHVMEIAYDPDTHRLFTMRQIFTRDITPADFRVDIDNSTITVGNDVFVFTSHTLILRRGTPFSLGDISPDDTVTLVTLNGNVWLIDVTYGHGFLEFTNINDVVEGRAIIDPLGQGINRFANLDDRVALPEGTYRVTVEGRNIEAFVTEIEIVQGQTTTIDLTAVEPSAVVLELTVSPSGSRVYINNALTSLHAAMEFEFGSVISIRVERDGFYTYSRNVEMNLAVISINVTLEEETPEPEVSNLHIFSMPAGAQIWVNNQPVGIAPAMVELEPGVHSVMAAAVGFYDYSTVVNVSAGENSVTLIMEPIVETPPPQIPTPPPEDPPPNDDPPWYIPQEDDPYNGGDE